MARFRVTIPPSKSVSHRALICAALAPGNSLIRTPLRANDLERTRDCLTALGATFVGQGEDLVVTGIDRGHPPSATIRSLYMADSGTTCRLLTAVAAAVPGISRVHGTPRMHDRPIAPLTTALVDQSVEVRFEEKTGFPPLLLNSSGLSGGEVEIDCDASSQFLSGLLLAAPLAETPTTLLITGEKVVSWPYVSITLQVMRDFGVDAALELSDGRNWRITDFTEVDSILPGRARFRVRPATYAARTYAVEGDWSNASYFLAASALLPGRLAVSGLRPDSLQGDMAIVDILTRMGVVFEWRDGDLIAVNADLRGVDVDMGRCPDLVPTVAVLAALAEGPTHIRNVAHLRIKECDRLDAVCAELSKVGCRTVPHADSLEIHPVPLQKRVVDLATYHDHRMPMSLSLLELVGLAPRFDHPECVAKSFPGFWEQWNVVRECARA